MKTKKVTLGEAETDKLARVEYDHQRWAARLESLQAQTALVQTELAEAKRRKDALLAELGTKHGQVVNGNLETGELEVVEPELDAQAEIKKLAKKK